MTHKRPIRDAMKLFCAYVLFIFGTHGVHKLTDPTYIITDVCSACCTQAGKVRGEPFLSFVLIFSTSDISAALHRFN